MTLGEQKNKDLIINFNLPSTGLYSDYILDVYTDIKDDVMLIVRAAFNYLQR